MGVQCVWRACCSGWWLRVTCSGVQAGLSHGQEDAAVAYRVDSIAKKRPRWAGGARLPGAPPARGKAVIPGPGAQFGARAHAGIEQDSKVRVRLRAVTLRGAALHRVFSSGFSGSFCTTPCSIYPRQLQLVQLDHGHY